MTETEITTLAREYAEEVYKDIQNELGIPSSVSETESIANLKEGIAQTIRFLLRRFCLVEKEKLKAIRFRKVYSADDVRSKFTEECLIDALFPEIAKEVGS